jgi:hypothetical protein
MRAMVLVRWLARSPTVAQESDSGKFFHQTQWQMRVNIGNYDISTPDSGELKRLL